MKNSFTFHPAQLKTPADIKANRRFQEVKSQVQKAKDTVMAADNEPGVDQDNTPGRVVVDGFRGERREDFIGVVGTDEVVLDSTRRVYDEYGNSNTQTKYRADSDSVSISKKEQGEEFHGNYHGISYSSASYESFTTNADGTVTYKESRSRREHAVGEW